jgi:site-specific recombinase XerD
MLQAVETLITQWLDYLSEQGKSAYTIIAYQRGLRHFIRWSEQTYEEPFDVVATLPRDLERWKTYQARTQKSAPATINQRLVAVSRFFDWCVETEIIAKAPTRSVQAIRLEKHKPRSISDIQLNRLLRAVHKGGNWRDMAMIEVLSGSGIRVGELLALQVGDLIDLDKRSAHLIVRQGKNASYRIVPLTKTVRQALTDYLAQYRHGDDSNALLWLGRKGTLTHSSSVLRLLDKYCIQAKIEKVTPHQLRHTFATRYLRKNPADLRGLAALLGHTDLNTVMLYTEPSLDDLTQRMEALDEEGFGGKIGVKKGQKRTDKIEGTAARSGGQSSPG